MSERPVRGGRGGRGGFRGGRGGGSDRGGRGMGRERGGRGGEQRGGRFSGPSRGRGLNKYEERGQSREEARIAGAESFIKSGRAARDAERLAKHKVDREAAKSKARATRIDPRIESITVGAKQVWKESHEEANWCKLSCKFFTAEKIKKLKVTIDCRFKIKSIKYRTDIHFDDMTHVTFSNDLKTMTIETRIPTLFEVGTPITDSDGKLSTDWQEGRGLDWQQASKNPHPNRYTFVFVEGAFKEDSLALFMNCDDRIKMLIQKENSHLAQFQRGSKRSRDEVAADPEKKEKTKSTGGDKTQNNGSEKNDAKSPKADGNSKPAAKKQKVAEGEAIAVKSDAKDEKKALKKKDSKKDLKENSMDVDAPAPDSSSSKTPEKKTSKSSEPKSDSKKSKKEDKPKSADKEESKPQKKETSKSKTEKESTKQDSSTKPEKMDTSKKANSKSDKKESKKSSNKQ